MCTSAGRFRSLSYPEILSRPCAWHSDGLHRRRFEASTHDHTNECRAGRCPPARDIGVRGSALKWFINYLTDRQQQVRCGNTVSAPTSLSRGVPQGSILGPLLFLLYTYTRKVPEVLSATKTIKSVLFADDILIYCSGKTPTTLDGSTICLSSSQTCSTVRMRTGLHSQTHARTDSFDQVNEHCEQSSMHRPQHQQRPYSLF